MTISIEEPIRRWHPYRKCEVVAGIAAGLVTEAAMIELHHLTPEELARWRVLYGSHGGEVGRLYVWRQDRDAYRRLCDEHCRFVLVTQRF